MWVKINYEKSSNVAAVMVLNIENFGIISNITRLEVKYNRELRFCLLF